MDYGEALLKTGPYYIFCVSVCVYVCMRSLPWCKINFNPRYDK